MLSKAHLHMRKLLKDISRYYNVPVFEEVKEGNKKYDFYFPSSPPLCIEVNGEQHFSSKVDGFFFKEAKTLLSYKKNDEERISFHKLGRIFLLSFSTEDFPTFDEFISLLSSTGTEQILKNGVDELNVYYQRYKRDKGKSEERKRTSREYWKNIRKSFSNGNRSK